MRIRPIVIATLLFAANGAAVAQTQKMMVPAFFALNRQSDSSKPLDWVRIQNAGSTVKIVVALGGAGGFETCSPATCSVSAAQSQFVGNYNAGQLVFGYVDSAFASADVIGGQFGANAWHDLYPTQVQGMFLDNGPSFGQSTKTEAQYQVYYESQYNQIHSLSGWQVYLNASQFPGTTQTAQPQDWVVAGCPNCSPPANPAADYALIYEQTETSYYPGGFKAIGPGGILQSPPAWWSDPAYQGRLTHTVTNVSQYHLDDMVNLSRSRNPGFVPYLYVFDGSSKQYAQVACYFEEEVAKVNNQSHGAGKTLCGGTCTDLNTDRYNCGECGYYCGAHGRCSGNPTSGVPCICDAGYHWCDDRASACVSNSQGLHFCP